MKALLSADLVENGGGAGIRFRERRVATKTRLTRLGGTASMAGFTLIITALAVAGLSGLLP